MLVKPIGTLGLLLGLLLGGSLGGCQTPIVPGGGYLTLNSRYRDEQPALSGDGRFLAFISHRNGRQELAVYDLQQNRFLVLPQPGPQSIVASPSLSRSGRYLVYRVSDRGQPRIELFDRITQRRQPITLGYRSDLRNPSISPDGRYVAFESDRNGQWDIQVIDRGSRIELDLPQGAASRSVRSEPVQNP
ncbi:MAG: biopolymer transporter Tol [Synechococcales cyanobacterium CRU_2_2]|nr:biopolymer transporter Tol [Synechococcales cyanobacterium CRU_2_2]